MQNPSAMVDIVMIVPAGPAVSEAALLPLPALFPVLLLFPVPVATAPPDPVPGRGAPVVSTLRVHRATGLTRLQTTRKGCRGNAVHVKHRSRRWTLDVDH